MRRGPLALLAGSLIALASAAPAQAIVGGDVAPPGRWPFMAALLQHDTRDAGWAQFCGGVVIGARRVLTTGHCVIETSPKDVDVLVGRTRLSETGGRRLRATSIAVYPGYVSDRTPGLDAAVVTVGRDLGVPAVALAVPGQEALWPPGALAWTAGWGQLNARPTRGGNSYYADRLRELQQPIQSDDACERVYGIGWADLPYLPSQLFCSGDAAGTAGGCYGDSGGPRLVATPAGWLDVGIDVGSDSCAPKGYYDLSTRVDRVSGFALGAHPARQPVPVAAPAVRGRLARGRVVRCATGRWHGRGVRLAVAWRRARSGRVVGHGRRHRVDARDAGSGLRCVVTATNRGGRGKASSPVLRRVG